MRQRRQITLIGLLVVGLAHGARAETVGAVGSRSAHEPGSPEETLEQAHRPRHGGSFGDADDLYHYEAVLEPPDRLILYVNDERNRPLDVRHLDGRWTLNPDAPTPTAGAFTPSEDGSYFHATLPSVDAEAVHIEVAVLKGEVWAPMEFFLPLPRPSAQRPVQPAGRPLPTDIR